MAVPISELAEILEARYQFATIYAALLDNNLQLNLAVTGDASGNTFTSATAHKLVTGSRIRFTVASGGGNFLPGGLSDTIDYYVIKTSNTVFQIAATLALALANTAIDFSSNGQGVLINEQSLNSGDPMEVLINHELASGNGYTERIQVQLQSATTTPTEARKTATPFFLAPSGGNLVYRHIALLINGSQTIGDTFGELINLQSEANPITVNDGDLKTLAFRLYAQQV